MNRIFKNILVLVGIITIAASCQYKYTVEPVAIPPQPGDTVSFSLQIEPIWTEQNCISCHPSSADPDLTVGNSYNSITSLGFVVADQPVESKIYYYPLPDGDHYVKYTSSQAALILLWIEEGAKNN